MVESRLIGMTELAQLLGVSRTLAHYYLKALAVETTSAGRQLFVHDHQVAGIVQAVADYRNRERSRKK